jgi:hypothetical protein
LTLVTLFFRHFGLMVARCSRLACPVDRVPALRLITRRQIRPTVRANCQQLNLRNLALNEGGRARLSGRPRPLKAKRLVHAAVKLQLGNGIWELWARKTNHYTLTGHSDVNPDAVMESNALRDYWVRNGSITTRSFAATTAGLGKYVARELAGGCRPTRAAGLSTSVFYMIGRR